jgi:hypothetical protein
MANKGNVDDDGKLTNVRETAEAMAVLKKLNDLTAEYMKHLKSQLGTEVNELFPELG